MKTHKSIIHHHRALTAGLLVCLFAFSACDSSNGLLESGAADSDLAPSVATLSEQLQLTESQSEEINAVLAKRGENEPGTLWYVAAELQSTLTDDQKTELFENMQEAREGTRAQGQRGRAARFRGQGEHFEDLFADLSDEQKAELKTLREAQREKMKALVEQRREGTLDETSMKEAAEQLRSEMEEQLAGILTDEQLAAFKEAQAERSEKMEARREMMKERFGDANSGERNGRRGRHAGRLDENTREAFTAAKIDALGLTEEQQSSIEAFRAEQKEKAQALFEEIKENGGDRDAVREQVETLRDESKSQMEEILTQDQLETITIHRALAFKAMKNRTDGAKGKRGNRRFNR